MEPEDSLLTEKIVADVRYVAARTCRRLASPIYSREDVQQSILLRIVEQAAGYDQRLGSARTFGAVVARHEAACIISKAFAQKRDCRRCTTSLNQTVAGTGGSGVEVVETISTDDFDGRFRRTSRSSTEILEMRIDVDRAVKALSPDLRALAHELFMVESPALAAGKLGIGKATAYRRLDRLRTVFQAMGLDRYLMTAGWRVQALAGAAL